MMRLTKINYSNIYKLSWLIRLSVLLVVALANTSLTTLAKADVSVEQTNHPGIEIVSSLSRSFHEPGSFINFVVHVDPTQNIAEILVLTNSSRTGIDPVILSGPLFAGAMAIPNEYTGPVTFTAVASDTTETVIGSSVVISHCCLFRSSSKYIYW